MTSLGNRLFWKISATLLLMAIAIGIAYVWISVYTANKYFQEVNQQMYGGLAEHLVQETSPLPGGKPDTTVSHDIMHSMMVINPSVEVYLLDTNGVILDYVVPFNEVKLDKVDLKPIYEFMETNGSTYLVGDDPKSPGVCNVFSAAPIKENDQLIGYAYIILSSEEYQKVSTALMGSFFLRSGTLSFIVALVLSILLGLLVIWLLTRNINHIVAVFRRFKEGELSARIPIEKNRDAKVLAETFNDMADTIVNNIEQLKSVESLRRELIANVSHDLRTPLSIMQGYVETLLLKQDTLTKEERVNYLNIVFSSSEKLGKLISQLFEYSKLESNQITPEKAPFFIVELLQDISQKYQILAKEKSIQLKMHVPKDQLLVYADIALVDRAIQNLMDNAIKFTPEGGSIVLEVKELDGEVEVHVSDTGPGIPENLQSAVFERYKQGSAGALKDQGAGLGLAIVKKIMDLHDASIRMHSKLNEGTSFVFQLPTYGKKDVALG